MQLTVDRRWKRDAYTIGKLYVNGIELCDTLEDKDRNLVATMPLEELKKQKIWGQTAIPTGTYKVKMTFSSKFSSKAWGKKYGGKVPEILNVPGFTGVRLHPGNTAQDTLGCLLVGKNSSVGRISQSVDWYYKLLDNYIIPATNKGEKITLTIK